MSWIPKFSSSKKRVIGRTFTSRRYKSPIAFLNTWITILVCTSLLYFFLHLFIQKGAIVNKLATEDVTILNNFPDPIDSFKVSAKNYLRLRFRLSEEGVKSTSTAIDSYGKKDAITILSKVGAESKSFFWLINDLALLEVLFWALFGTICSYLYYYVENYKKGTIDVKEHPSYAAKLFYTPFVTIVIYLSPDVFSSDTDYTKNFDYWTILIAFILGFFSGRAIELLDRIKNLIFPYKSENDSTNQSTAPVIGIPEEVYVQAIKDKASEWSEKYDPIEGVSVSKKIVEGETQEQLALQFHVLDKRTRTDPEKNIPPTINYRWNNQDYELLTDIVQTNEIVSNNCYRKDDDSMYIGSNLKTKFLGLSCSRKLSVAGTIGFKLRSKNIEDASTYMLSCYHVLCYNEMLTNKFEFNTEEQSESFEVVSPESKELGASTIGYLKKGILNNEVDAAVARLTSDNNLNTVLYGTSFSPRTIVIIGSSHANLSYPIILTGRTSCRQNGYIISHYANVNVKYYRNGKVFCEKLFEGVIKTCKISTYGDSGAPVVDTNGNAIGILFASDDEYSYIIPLLKIFKHFNLTFIKPK